MDYVLIVLGLVVFILLSTLVVFVIKLMNMLKQTGDSTNIMSVFQKSSQEDRKLLLSTLQNNTNALNQRLDRAAAVIGQVQKHVGELIEVGRGMKDLQQFLHSPKKRGTIGEHILKELLTDILPKQTYSLQYRFRNGATVDAIVKTAHGLIPIDSKFPMEQFRVMNESEDEKNRQDAKKLFKSDVKKHIESIAEKYIQTDNQTTDYALMYIPSESVYYEIVNDGSLYDYATKLRILPVSPTTFYAFLRAILISFEGELIETHAKEVIRSFRSIIHDFEKVESNLSILGKHITNAYNTMQTTTLLSDSVGKKMKRTLTGGEKQLEPPAS